ncbi:hypothetical protein STSP2_01626 [Anaerohalosphaera lusitana]|uniref:Uncharacterized protein n=1 Tax=Anaerohalosphaera lusitana TaxID=1936003 RepID=A0A1U9NKJ7_9BACT|nr:hypothetical protein [Anaerohalosphaera lusitana]AQT68462.1 hypothetical protein STSP2_01626 [Anaerohalosphaera lusitana]
MHRAILRGRSAFRMSSLVWIMVLAFFVAVSGESLARTFGDIRVVAQDNPQNTGTTHGYLQYEFLVTNSSSSQTHEVTLELPGNSYRFGGDALESITRTRKIAAGDSVIMQLLQPPVPGSGDGLAVYINGARQKEMVSFSFRSDHGQNFYMHSGSGIVLRVSRDVNQGELDSLIEKVWGSSSHGYRSTPTVKTNKTFKPVSEWPRNWLAYSAYDSIVVEADELDRAGSAVKQAVADYVRAGGSLTVLGQSKPDPAWGFAESSREELLQDGARVSYVGFGSIAMLTDDNAFTSSDNQTLIRTLKDEVWDKSKPKLIADSVQQANNSFAVIEDMSIPVRGLFGLILLFAVVMGPANLFILSRKKRRIYMLWTVPLISIAASLAVVFYATFAEGWRGFARHGAVTYLDQSAQRASTVGIAAYYSPMTPSGGLHFDFETAVLPVGLNRQHSSAGSMRTIDWTNDQHLKSGWIFARVPAHFQLRRVGPSRLRMNFERKDDKLHAGNGLGKDIHKLWYADDAGDIFVAADIVAGQEEVMMRDPNMSVASADSDAFRKVHERRWNNATTSVITSPASYLEPNSYMAIIRKPVFVEPALTNLKENNHMEVIIGSVKGGRNGS